MIILKYILTVLIGAEIILGIAIILDIKNRRK